MGVIVVLTFLADAHISVMYNIRIVDTVAAEGWRKTDRAGEGACKTETRIIGIIFEIIPLYTGET
jgi:hypothetical protein